MDLFIYYNKKKGNPEGRLYQIRFWIDTDRPRPTEKKTVKFP